MPAITPDLDSLIQGDCLEIMSQWQDGCIDHCITDPPYNMSKKNGLGWAFSKHVTMSEAWDMYPRGEYLDFTRAWLQEVTRVVKPNGNIFVFGSFHNIYDIGHIIHEMGLKLINSIVWHKCIAGNTPMLVITDGTARLLPMRDLEKYQAVQLFSFDHRGRGTTVNLKRFEKSPTRSGLRITLKSGLQVTVTANHRIPVVKAGEIVEVFASHLEPGEHMLVLTHFPVPEPPVNTIRLSDIIGRSDKVYVNNCDFADQLKGRVLLRELAYGYGYMKMNTLQWHVTTQKKMPLAMALDYNIPLDGKMLSEKKSRNKAIPNDVPLNYDTGFLIGAYLAEGSISESTVQISLHAEERDFRRRISLGLAHLNLQARFNAYRNSGHLNVSSRVLQAFIFHFVQAGTAKEKCLLDPCFSAPREFRQGVLDGYVEGDGCQRGDNCQRITCTHTHNEGLQDSLIALARSLGVSVIWDRRNYPIKANGFSYPVDTLRLRKAGIEQYSSLPVAALRLYRASMYGSGHTSIATARKVTRSFTPLQEWFVSGEMRAEEVVKLEAVEDTEFYDIEVDGNSIFATANGILTHNSNAQPNITARTLTESTEHIIWAVNAPKEKAKGWTFNYKLAKALNGGKQLRNVWEFPYPSRTERRFGKHPSQKPVKLIGQIVLIASNEGDSILDCFAGSGTTGVVARSYQRRYVMVESSPEYVDIIRARLEHDHVPLPKALSAAAHNGSHA